MPQKKQTTSPDNIVRTDSLNDPALLKQILNTTDNMIFWKDTERRFLGANEAFLEYYGFSSVDEILGKTDEDMNWHPDPDQFQDDEIRVLNGECTHNIHGQCMCRGELRDIVASKSPLYVDGKVYGLVGSFTDVTEAFRNNREINVLNEELEETNRSINSFISRMSHEMRTPMNAIIGLSDLALDKTTDKIAVDYLKKIQSSGQYLLNIINDVLDIRKIAEGNLVLRQDSFLLSELLTAVDTIIRPLAEEKGVHYTVSNDSKDLYLLGDVIRIEQILVNLLNNAIKFTEPGGMVEFFVITKAQKDQIRLTFTVRDTGCGMSQDFLPKLFIPFSQENRNPSKYGSGTGLGLAISKQYAQMMGGEITVASIEGKGSSFIVWIVLDPATGSENSEDAESRPNKRKIDLSILSGQHVLLVEDNELNAEITIELLAEYDVAVDLAHDGLEGLEMFRNSAPNDYHAILMDVRMPRMDGYEATRSIRALSRRDAWTVPIIAMSADVMEETMRQAKECGMDGYVAKPVNREKFLDTLADCIQKTERSGKYKML